MRIKAAKQITLTFVIVLTAVIIAGSAFAYETDSYGGNMDIKSEATGFFRIERINDQHIFITPEGHGYVAIGVTHFQHSKRTDYDQVISELKEWGFTAGDYTAPSWMWNLYPYALTINFINIKIYDSEKRYKYEDVFSPEFDEKIDGLAKEIAAPKVNNKMLLGYFMSNVPMWTKGKFGKTWITYYKSLDPESPGGKAWAKWKAANKDKDENEFVPVIADVVYKKGTEMIRKYDPNHLIFSDKYHEKDFPADVIRAAAPYVDAIATQTITDPKAEFFEILKEIDKPLYLGDHTADFRDERYPNPSLPTEEDYIRFYRDYMDKLFDFPCVIGYNVCQYNDHTNRPGAGTAKRGLVDHDYEPHAYTKALKPIYQKARQKVYDRVLK